MGKMIFATILFVIAGGILFVYTQPTYSSVGSTQTQIGQYQQALQNAAQLDALRQQLLQQYNSFNPTDLARLNTMLPDQVDNIGLILDLDDIASRYGLALENVDVSAPSSGTPSETAAVGATDASPYGSITLEFSTYGTYQSFESFLTDLEQSLRLVDLVSLKIAAQSPAPGAPANAYRYDMTIRTYWLK